MNILYNRGELDLKGDVVTKEQLSSAGIRDAYTNNITPYQEALLVTYDQNPKQLRIVENSELEKWIDASALNYAPHGYIIDTPTTQVDFRWLVDAIPQK